MFLVLFFLFEEDLRGLFCDNFCIWFLKLFDDILGLNFFLIIGINDGDDWNGFVIVICKRSISGNKYKFVRLRICILFEILNCNSLRF